MINTIKRPVSPGAKPILSQTVMEGRSGRTCFVTSDDVDDGDDDEDWSSEVVSK